MSGWIVPVKGTKYPLKNNTFYITTKSVTGGTDSAGFYLYDQSGGSTTNIKWNFDDWAYFIKDCTLGYSLQFPVTPPADIRKTWEIIVTAEDVKIKCNTLEVLHFIFNDTYTDVCIREVKGKIPTQVKIWNQDTATKTFTSELAG